MRLLPAAETPALDVAPVVLSEFGGIQFAPTADIATWGYSEARTAEEFEVRLRAIVTAAATSSALAGYCCTQLTDTVQEANGLVDQHRRPKLPLETIRRSCWGRGRRRPRRRRMRAPGPLRRTLRDGLGGIVTHRRTTAS